MDLKKSSFPAAKLPEIVVPRRRLFWKSLAIMMLVGLAPMAAWLIGSGIVMATPPVYQSEAWIRLDSPVLDPAEIRQEAEKLRSGAVVKSAARAMAREGGLAAHPMSEYILWSSLTVREHFGGNLIKVVARRSDPEEARRIVVAVAEAYERHGARPGSGLVYIDPLMATPPRVADETRMMLGVAGFASLGLLLSIPLLRRLERALPQRTGELPASFVQDPIGV